MARYTVKVYSEYELDGKWKKLNPITVLEGPVTTGPPLFFTGFIMERYFKEDYV